MNNVKSGNEEQQHTVKQKAVTSLPQYNHLRHFLQELEAAKKIHISGCISIIEMWVYGNLYIIAGIATGVAFAQVSMHAAIQKFPFLTLFCSFTAFCNIPRANSRGPDTTPEISVASSLTQSSAIDTIDDCPCYYRSHLPQCIKPIILESVFPL